ncbi:hypothetical protein ACFO26_09745 [Lactococcus nasutitermitis]|uniref:Uncharacterized protein n=1 Tax=Lactococcus nasutitermitis TaxID=1652957 RepID=A0ABV9JIG7_9LACT|nr:hypothetical protein [Lactococcus nasutitermitis]
MKAKLGNTTIDYWKISTDKPENEPWLMEAFEKKQLAWSGKLVMERAERQKLHDNDMAGKENNSTEAAWSWLLLYVELGSFANAYPYNIYLLVNQPRIPAFGQVGEYLVKAPDGSLEVYSEKKFERDLKVIL